MERESAWKRYDEDQLAELEQLAAGYIDFISENKTEREFSAAAIRSAEAAGYESLDAAISAGRKLAPGDKVWATMRNKAVILVQLGARPLTDGMNILGAHIDSPRLDVKQNPLYESSELAFMDTHYYGGIKHYQWVTVPLALHGVIAKKDGSVVDVKIGEDADDPVFCISDLLIHLANQQMGKKANEVVEGEALDILVGNRPLVVRDEDGEAKEQKDPVKAFALKLLADKYGIEEEDFLSAELEVVPAGRARDLGFDRSMVLGYGQDDSVCAYTSLVAQLAVAGEELDRAAVCVLVDKEEIGSVGATGMAAVLREHHRRDHGTCRRGRHTAAAPCTGRFRHALLRRLRRLRPRLRQRVRGEEQRVSGPRPGVQQVHGCSRQVGQQRRPRRVHGAHPQDYGRRRRAVPNLRAGQGRRRRRRDHRVHPRQVRHGRH